jgi:hypothetical protein
MSESRLVSSMLAGGFLFVQDNKGKNERRS